MDFTVQNLKPTFRRIQGQKEGNLFTLRLDPGANLVSLEDLNAVKKNPHVRELFKRGILVEAPAPKADRTFSEGDSVMDLSELKVPDALKAIAACESPQTLKMWSNTEPRKSVKEALIARHSELIDPTDEQKE